MDCEPSYYLQEHCLQQKYNVVVKLKQQTISNQVDLQHKILVELSKTMPSNITNKISTKAILRKPNKPNLRLK